MSKFGTAITIVLLGAACMTTARADLSIGFWQVTIVDSGGAQMPSLTVLHTDYPAIAYWDWTIGLLKYAWAEPAGWHLETVATAPGNCRPSLAVLPSGASAIAYYDAGLRFAERGDGGWEITRLPALDGLAPSLIVLPSGQPAISYVDIVPGSPTVFDLKYTWFDGQQWQVEEVVRFTADAQVTSAAVLPSAAPAIACGSMAIPSLFGTVTFSVRNATWSTTTIQQRGNSIPDASLRMLSSGQPALGYTLRWLESGELAYTEYNGSAWQTVTLAAGLDANEPVGASLAILRSGEPGIAFVQAGSVRFAWRAVGQWSIQEVAPAIHEDHATSLVRLPSGQPAIAFRGASTPGNLGYALAFFRGDVNCDGLIDFADINPFVLALSDPAAYGREYPNCSIMLADVNADGLVNFDDINPFAALITGGCCPLGE